MRKIVKLFMLLALPALANAQQYDYAKMLGGVSGDSYGQSVVSDNAGNVYIKGTFSGSHKIGSTIYKTPGIDAFIAKYNSLGILIWYKNIGFDEADIGASDITLDASNNIYITGSFSGSSTIEGTTLTNAGTGTTQDIYVVKYDTDGVFQWARSFGGTGRDFGQSIAVDAAANVYIGGYTKSTSIDFNGFPIATGALSSITYWVKLNADGTDSYIRFGASTGTTGFNIHDMDISDATGSLFMAGSNNTDPFYQSVDLASGFPNWIQNISTGTWIGEAFGIKSFGADLYITGYFELGNIEFPPIGVGNVLTNIGQSDIFLISVDSTAGSTNWLKAYGGTRREQGTAITINPTTSELYITGNYSSPGLTLMGSVLPTPSPSGSPFIALANTSGNEAAAIAIPTTDVSGGTGVAVNNTANSLFATGSFNMKGTFGIKDRITKNNSFYLTTYDLSLLGFNWAITPPKGEIIVQDIVVDNNDNLFIAGYFEGTIDVLGNQIASSEIGFDQTVPKPDLFVAKILANETLAWIKPVGGLDADTLKGISYDGAGSVYMNTKIINAPTIAGTILTATETGNVIVKIDQDGNFVYAKPVVLPVGSDVTAMVGDNDIGSNDVFVGGYFSGTTNLLGYNITSLGLTDLFLFKFDLNGSVPTGGLITFRGTGSDMLTDMAKAPGGNIKFTGWSNSPTLSSTPFGPQIDIVIPAGNSYDVIVGTVSTFPEAISGFSDGGPSNQYATNISVNITNDIAITGKLNGGGDFSGTILSGALGIFYFIASYDSTYLLNSANKILTSGDPLSSITDVIIDSNNNLYLSGKLHDPLNFGTGNVFSIGQSDGFLTSYNNTGALLYTETYGGDYSTGTEAFEGYDYGLTMAINSLDELWYSGTLSVKPATFGSFTLQPDGSDGVGISEGMDSYLFRLADPGTIPTAVTPKMYWTDETNKEINRSNLDGTLFEQYHTEIDFIPRGIAIDTLNQIIYWTNGQGQIRKGDIDAAGLINVTDFINDALNIPREMNGLALDVAGGKIYWASTYDSAIKSADLFAPSPITTIQSVVTGLEKPRGIAVDPVNGKLYYTVNIDGTTTTFSQYAELHQANLDGSADITLYTLDLTYESSFFNDVKLDITNNMIYWSSTSTETAIEGNRVYSASLLDVAGTVTSFTTVGEPIGIDLDRTTGKIYWVEKEVISLKPYEIIRANFDGTIKEILQSGIFNLLVPKYLALDISQPVTGCLDPPTVTAGGDDIICEGDLMNLAATMGGAATSILWSTGGDGTFDINTSLAAVYTPGVNDVLNGTVTLTITTDDPDGTGPCIAAIDSMVLTISQAPTVTAGTDLSICEGADATLAATMGGSATAITWTTTGDGTFDDNTSLTAIYTPGATDITNATVTLTVTTNDPDATGPCVAISDNLILTITQAPTVTAGTDFSICEGADATLAATMGGSAATITWTTTGDGTFDDNTSLTAVYTPGATDISSATATLTIATNDPDGTGSCVAATDNLLISFEQLPTADAGADQSICPADVVVLAGTLGGSATTATWTSNGDGSFNDPNNLAANYTPGTSDAGNGTVTLTLTSTNTLVCSPAIDQMVITLNPPILAIDQSASLDVEETIIINATNGAAVNSGDVLTTTLLTSPQKGTAIVNADGTISYTATIGNVGADSFDFQISNQCNQTSSAQVNITINNQPPTVEVPPSEVVSGGTVSVNIIANITDNNGNVDLSSLRIIIQPLSGAIATLDTDGNLTVNYAGLTFTGTDELTIEICDFDGLCSQQIIYIEVAPPTVIVYNAVSPNGDGKHDYLEIENAEFFPDNRVRILNRWGDVVYEISGYDNLDNKFDGQANKGGSGELPPGTYFYSIFLGNDSAEINGFFDLRR